MTYRTVLGNWGEVHACRLLKSAKFTDIVLLNVGRQHPAGDVMARKMAASIFSQSKPVIVLGRIANPTPATTSIQRRSSKAAKSYRATPAWLLSAPTGGTTLSVLIGP